MYSNSVIDLLFHWTILTWSRSWGRYTIYSTINVIDKFHDAMSRCNCMRLKKKSALECEKELAGTEKESPSPSHFILWKSATSEGSQISMTSEHIFQQEERKLLVTFQMVSTCNWCVVTATYCPAMQLNFNNTYTLGEKKKTLKKCCISLKVRIQYMS